MDPKIIDIIVGLDLEMSQPSQRIIEIGVAVGSIVQRKILASKSFFVNPHEPLSDFIKNLTHITQENVDAAPNLGDAYNSMVEFLLPFNPHRMVIQWGQGDERTLKEQLSHCGQHFEWMFGRTAMNVKNIVQAHQIALGRHAQGGLAKSLLKYGLRFEGTKHRADSDAVNTLRLFFKMLDILKTIELDPNKMALLARNSSSSASECQTLYLHDPKVQGQSVP